MINRDDVFGDVFWGARGKGGAERGSREVPVKSRTDRY